MDISTPVITAESIPVGSFASDLVSEVRMRLKDSGFDSNTILSQLNKGLRVVAGQVLIPSLEASAIISTSTANHVRMPSDYHWHLRYCHSTTLNRRIKIFQSLLGLYRKCSVLDSSGRVWGVALQGRNLYYQGIPSTPELLFINYFRYPEPIDSYDEKPDCLPDDFVEPLLVNYAAWKLYQIVEDGIESERPNTSYYKAEFAEAMALFKYHVGAPKDEPEWIPEEISYEEFA